MQNNAGHPPLTIPVCSGP